MTNGVAPHRGWNLHQPYLCCFHAANRRLPCGLCCHFMLCPLNESDRYNVFAHKKPRHIVRSCQTNWTGAAENISIRTALHFSLKPRLIDSSDSWRRKIVCVCVYFQEMGLRWALKQVLKKWVKMWIDNCNVCFLSPQQGGRKQMWQVLHWDSWETIEMMAKLESLCVSPQGSFNLWNLWSACKRRLLSRTHQLSHSVFHWFKKNKIKVKKLLKFWLFHFISFSSHYYGQ